MVKIKIAVLYNASKSKSTKEVESNLLDMAKSVAKALARNGHKVSMVNADGDMLRNLKNKKPDMVFNLAERFKGNSDLMFHVAALLEMNNVPFTGATPSCIITCDDKARAKELMQCYGIPTPKFQVFETGKEKLEAHLNFPLIVKPSKTHDSIGITNDSVVYNEKKMRLKIKNILDNLQQKAIVEEYIDGREFQVPVLGNDNPYTLPICEVNLSKSRSKVLGYEMKWHINWYKEAPIICPADIPKYVQELLNQIAIKIHKKFGLRDYSRADIRLKKGIPYILEVNPNPGLTEDCFIYHSAKAAGIEYHELIGKIVQYAAERYSASPAVKVTSR